MTLLGVELAFKTIICKLEKKKKLKIGMAGYKIFNDFFDTDTATWIIFR